MKILFVFSNYTDFVKNYVKSLKDLCSVLSVCMDYHNDFGLNVSQADYVLRSEESTVSEHYSIAHFHNEKFLEKACSMRAQLETLIKLYRPDVIHCNDAASFMALQFDHNIIYSCHLKNSCLNKKIPRLERIALQKSALCIFYQIDVLSYCTKNVSTSCCALLNSDSAQAHFFYYTQIAHHRFQNLRAAYNADNYKFMKLKQKPCFSFLKDVEITALKKISSNNNAIKKDSKTLVITTFAQQEEICNLFSCGHCINITESAENGIYYRSECLPFIDKSYENVIFSAVFEKSFDIQFTVQELLRISNHKVFIFDKNANIYALNVQNAMNF